MLRIVLILVAIIGCIAAWNTHTTTLNNVANYLDQKIVDSNNRMIQNKMLTPEQAGLCEGETYTLEYLHDLSNRGQ